MKGASWLALLVFAAAAIAGYLLTARSFAWVSKPNFGTSVQAPISNGTTAPPSPMPAIDLNALKIQIPPALMDQARKLTSKQLACLSASIRADRIQAVLQGHLTPQEAAAVAACLK